MAARCAGARRCARRCVSARTSFVTMPPGSSLLLLGVCRLTRLRPSTSTRCTSEPVRGQVSTARARLPISLRTSCAGYRLPIACGRRQATGGHFLQLSHAHGSGLAACGAGADSTSSASAHSPLRLSAWPKVCTCTLSAAKCLHSLCTCTLSAAGDPALTL